jgi:hypothetical protein
MIEGCMLTTFDNPYDPFEDFSQWFLFDVEQGYNSCAYLGRIARVSEQFTEEENSAEIERAIDEIIKYDFLNIYKKVSPKDKDNKDTNNTKDLKVPETIVS